MLHVQGKSCESRAGLESRENKLIGSDGRKPRQRNRERVIVKQCRAQQCQGKQDEIKRNAGERRAVRCMGHASCAKQKTGKNKSGNSHADSTITH